MSGARPRPTRGLDISVSGALKIGERGFTLADARAVHERRPLWRWQPARTYVDELGRLRTQPDRWRLIGRGLREEILSVVIELPGVDGESQVVTVYEASPRDQSEYAEWMRGRS